MAASMPGAHRPACSEVTLPIDLPQPRDQLATGEHPRFVRSRRGNWLLLAARSFHTADLFAGVILLGFTGLVSSTLLAGAERWLLRWRVRA